MEILEYVEIKNVLPYIPPLNVTIMDGNEFPELRKMRPKRVKAELSLHLASKDSNQSTSTALQQRKKPKKHTLGGFFSLFAWCE